MVGFRIIAAVGPDIIWRATTLSSTDMKKKKQ